MIVPWRGSFLWEWFFDASEMRNDHTDPMTAQDWLAWREMTGCIIHGREWKVLREMDKSYVIAMRKERSDMNARLAERQNNGHRRNRF